MTQARKHRLLILDDDPLIRAALERLLRNEFELVSTGELESAREAVRRQDFELALIDLHLGSGTSLDFFRELQHLCPTTVRVLVSGTLNLNSLVDSLDSTLVHKVLQKPWEPANLLLQIKEAMQLHQLLKDKEHLERLSTTDALTGLHNYRYLHSLLPKEIERAKRSSRPLSLIMVDVDGFKKWNDTKGHLQGDEVMRKIGGLIKDGLRAFDCLCRYGGDEFCILLQETELKTAFEIAERLRKKVEQDCPLTVSLGVAAYPQTSPSAERLLADADTALYSAKNQGRNRCVIAGTLDPG
jgi:diguanylate cyclase (GGDEF)-like protein